jgi:ribosomal protein S18 acetylase RimI-like enzyme
MSDFHIISVTPENIKEEKLFCITNVKSQGFLDKAEWFTQQYYQGLQLKILKTNHGQPAGFIEYGPAENAWRPVSAEDYLFINCIYVYPKRNQHLGYASRLINETIKDAQTNDKRGVTVMTSEGTWMVGKEVFETLGFRQIQKKGRFNLLAYKVDLQAPDPYLLNWESVASSYDGWNLLYADQCPWHQKAVEAIKQVAEDEGIQIKTRKFIRPEEAQNGPSGFGVFSLIHNGELLEDHYISATRFKNILKKEMSKEPAGSV